MAKPIPPKFWVHTTYFAEGLPYMLVRIISSVLFTDLGVKERFLGYLNFLGIPWNIKFLWAPLVDSISSLRSWMAYIQIILGVLTLVIAGCILSQPDASPMLTTIAWIFLVMAIFAATNDIAIDAHYILGLPSRDEQAFWSGNRVLAYRISMVFARSGLVALVAYLISQGFPKTTAWAWTFAIAGGVLVSLGVFHLLFLPASSSTRREGVNVRATFVPAFVTYFSRPKIIIMLTFVTLYKIGDELLFSMATPFLLRELAITKAQYSWISGILGAVGSIVGAMAGGWYIKLKGFERSIWPLTLFMNLNIWVYIGLAYFKPDPLDVYGITFIALGHTYEQLAAGIGSAVLLVYLLRTCLPSYRATHYAIGSALMSLPATLLGGFAGSMVEAIGYVNLFILAFIASLPAMFLIPFIPFKTEET